MIELLADAEARRLREIATQAAQDFADSVLAIYGSSRQTNRRLVHVGSCILLNVDGTPVVATAAHIADEITAWAILFVAGPVQRHLVPILGGSIKVTSAPGGDRRVDHFDGAFWRVPQEAAEALGLRNFLPPARLSHNRAPIERRAYTAYGFAVSRNKDGVDHADRSIVPSMHTSTVVSVPDLLKELGVSGEEHIFVRFDRHAHDADGASVNTFHPKGFSGGALLDLGDFTSPTIYSGDPNGRALLAGMIISYHKSHRALAAVRMGSIVSGIGRALRAG